MNQQSSSRLLPFALAAMLGALDLVAQPTVSDPGWPRHFTNGSADLVVYPPQIDGWSDFKVLEGRCAFSLKPEAGRDEIFGTFRFKGDTLADTDSKVVLMRGIAVSDVRFAGVAGDTAATLNALMRSLLPSDALVLSLDRLVAYMRASEHKQQEARVLTTPPPIIVMTQPAILVIIDGDPVMVDVESTALRRIVNTNWYLFQSRTSGEFYLRHAQSWLAAPELTKPFAPVNPAPAELQHLPASELKDYPAERQWGAGSPRVIVVNKPSELIVIRGVPHLAPIAGTSLSSLTNTDSDLFYHATARRYYYLASGRWFGAESLQGPWQHASTALPADFKKIPSNHAKAHVLAAVPGTREAEDAVLLAAIPRTAEINRREAKASAQYVGAPQFTAIPGTAVSYAANTPTDVLRVSDLYYLCSQGVWFVSASPQGPWQVADKIPQEIYSIPESSSKYHVTYVRIYETTPVTVRVGYTPGYYGAYISGGVVVWGTGYYYAPYVAAGAGRATIYWGAPCYTYGASAWYNPATATYARGAAVYGPYGGYGAAAAYNPRTGTYAQGASVWGPAGGAAAARTYNPSTGTYSAGYNAANPYRSWGEGVVTNGSNWARGGYESTSRGTVAAGQTSKGGSGVAIEGAGGKSGYVGKSGSGDVYAGANGNVYKRDNGQWYQNQNGSWSAMEKGDLSAQREQAAARDHGTRSAQLSERWRSAGNAGREGIEQRPRFQGRRR